VKQLDEIAAAMCFKFDAEPVDLLRMYGAFKQLGNEPKMKRVMQVFKTHFHAISKISLLSYVTKY
jgi:hypothetical protein